MTSWWNKKYGKDKLCGITRARLRPGIDKRGESYVVFLPCAHGFYRIALKNWVLTKPEQNPSCPMCRKIFHPLCAFI